MSQAATAKSLPVKMIWASHQGGGQSPTPSASWIDGPRAMDAEQFAGHPAPTVLSGAVDWKRYGLVWIRMGRKPTGGFAMRLAASDAEVQGDTAVLTVEWREPAKGAYVTQMITSPCMVLELARGDYRRIVVEDQAGRALARIDLRTDS